MSEIRAPLDPAVNKRTASGPNGVHYVLLSKFAEVMGAHFSILQTVFLRTLTFPRQWKKAKLPKLDRDQSSPSANRPICLLDVEGKLFGRIVASRIIAHLKNGRSDLSSNQIGFRAGRSTTDLLVRVRDLVQGELKKGGVVIAVLA